MHRDYNDVFCDMSLNKKDFMKRLKYIKGIRVKYKINCLLGRSHTRFLKKHHVFKELGDNVLYQPSTLPSNPKLIKIHNNVKIASDVTFYEHDVINSMFQKIDNENQYIGHLSCIEIFDNVFIGGKSIIVGNVKIGPNAIVGAGSVVTKDVPEGTIVAGNPAAVVGSFFDLQKKRILHDTDKGSITFNKRYDDMWEKMNRRK